MPTRPTVFLLESSPECRQATVALLRAHDYDCRTFDAVEGALGAIPDVESPTVVADFRFAIEILGRTSHAGRGVPVVAISPDSEPANREMALAAGAAMHLEKPYPPSTLLEYLDSLRSAE